jgi:acetolactate synthase-1/2/3 large subunit
VSTIHQDGGSRTAEPLPDDRPVQPAQSVSGGELLVRALKAHGVDLVFGIPGTHNLEIYAALDRHGVEHVTTRHEQGAGYAADAYARVTGRPGVAVTTTGPALLNIAAALAQAYSDSVPMLVISPGMPTMHPKLPVGLLHEMQSQTQAMAAIAAHSHRVHSLAEIPVAVAHAFALFRGGRPRPVHLEVPMDLLVMRTHDSRLAVAPALPRPAAPEAALEQAAAALRTAVRPLIVAGGGARHASRALTRLAESLGAPVATSANGKGALPETHPQSLGVALQVPALQRYLADAATGADVVLAVGTELAESDFWVEPPPIAGTLIRLDIDPAQAYAAHRADIALIGDAHETLTALEARLRAGSTGERAASPDALRDACRSTVRDQGRRWLPWLAAIRNACAPEAIFTSDSAMACYYGALANLPVEGPARFLHPTCFGTLGFALPAAIGAAVAQPDRQVVALSGDGGLQFSINELATAASLRRPLPVVVFDNNGYGEIRAQMLERGDRAVGVDLATPDLPAIARAYGGVGCTVSHPEELEIALRSALLTPTTTVIVVPEERP